jgi:GntR family transcriptional regulator, rspAB operon transcriptional repressor
MELIKLERQRAVDAVYEALREGILNSLFQPGERLHVDVLSTKLGVSLTPVRNAIQQLASEGLVEIRPRSGTFVASLSVRDVEETFEIRCALETLAAEKAAGLISPEQLECLNNLLASLSHPINSPQERKRHEKDNTELHQIIVSASNNRRLMEMYESLNAHLRIARIHASEDSWRKRLGEEHAEHRQIVEALEARDSEQAAASLRKHIYRAKDSLIASLKPTDHMGQ